MIEEKISEILNVNTKNISIIKVDDSGRITAKVKTEDNQSIIVHGNKDGSNIEIDLNIENKILEGSDINSQQRLAKAGAVWDCWLPNMASCK